MLSELVIIAGLAIDGAGALMIATPDLRPQTRYRIRNLTPILRKYEKKIKMLEDMDDEDLQDEDNIHTVSEIYRECWPAFKEYREWQIWNNENYSGGEIGGWDSVELLHTNRGIVIDTPVRERPFNISTDLMRNVLRDYIERKFRSWGWKLLAFGFGVQIVGTSIGLL